MRIVMLLVVLMVIGLIMGQMLNHKPPDPPISAIQQGATAGQAPLAVPTRAQDIKAFEQNMNRFIEDAAKQRARQEPAQ